MTTDAERLAAQLMGGDDQGREGDPEPGPGELAWEAGPLQPRWSFGSLQ
jgi:hypothetical protein